MKEQIKNFKYRIKKKVDKYRYNRDDAAPWLHLYEELGYPEKLVYPKGTMYEALLQSIKKYPDLEAYEYFGKKATYAEFGEQIKDCARGLQAIGVTPEDAVTIFMPNTPEAIVMFYACNMIGAVANMVHPLSSEGEIEFCLKKANSKYIITLDALYDKLYNIREKVELEKIILSRVNESMPFVISTLFWLTKGRKIKVESPHTRNVVKWKDFIYNGRKEKIRRSEKKDTDLAIILYSGGTTGTPKGIMLNSRNGNAASAQYQIVCKGLQPKNILLCIMPIFHVFGLTVCFHTNFLSGMKAVIIPKFTPEEFGGLIKKHQPNFIVGVPTLFEALLKTDLKEDGLECVENVISGGDMLTPELQRKVNTFLKEHGCEHEIRVGWGMTECSGAATATPLHNFIPGSIGIPSPDNYVKIVKSGTEENVFYDDDGELCVSGPLVMMGYLDDEEETKNTLRVHSDGRVWLHTGDMATMNRDGMIFFKSRIKRMIISSGYNIYPNQVENVLNGHPDVMTSIVVGEPHEYKGEIAKAFVVLNPGAEKSDQLTNEIMEHCKKNLAKYMLPTSIEYRETIPTTKMGKADYRNVQ